MAEKGWEPLSCSIALNKNTFCYISILNVKNYVLGLVFHREILILVDMNKNFLFK